MQYIIFLSIYCVRRFLRRCLTTCVFITKEVQIKVPTSWNQSIGGMKKRRMWNQLLDSIPFSAHHLDCAVVMCCNYFVFRFSLYLAKTEASKCPTSLGLIWGEQKQCTFTELSVMHLRWTFKLSVSLNGVCWLTLLVMVFTYWRWWIFLISSSRLGKVISGS